MNGGVASNCMRVEPDSTRTAIGVPSAAMSHFPSETFNSRIRAAYFALQGAGVLVWWTVLFHGDQFISHFIPATYPTETLTAFFPADLLFAAGSFTASWLAARRHTGEVAVASFVTGCACYATCWCFAVWLQTGDALASVVFMAPCAFSNVVCATWAARRL